MIGRKWIGAVIEVAGDNYFNLDLAVACCEISGTALNARREGRGRGADKGRRSDRKSGAAAGT
jgi:hypothetical protein